ncbi:MAG: hypothetical protein AB8I56_14060 [Anaerolineales bacterium]
MMKNLTNDPSPVALSISLYGMLLAAYPTGFRHEYGPHMAQVFRDCCLRSYRQAGYPGMLNLWIFTLIDYIKTVFEEHMQRGMNMYKSTFIRLSGLALALGAVTNMISWLISIRDVPEYNPNNYLSRPIDLYLEYVIAILLPVTFLLLMVGMIGLFLRYRKDTNGFGNFGLILGVLGGVINFGAAIPLFTNGPDWSWTVWMVGTLLYFLGLVVFGIAAVRDKLLPRWNALPILTGIWIPILFIGTFQMEWEATEYISLGAFLLTGIGLVGLGLLLKSDIYEEVELP